MPKVRVYLLGAPRVELDGKPIDIRRRKSLALLAYLAITGQPHRRETLAALLWPDYGESQASAYLRRELWALRQKIGEEWVEADSGQMSLVEHPELWVDVLEFKEVLGEADKAETVPEELEALEKAVAVYQGDFLVGFTLLDAPAFDDWQFFQGDALRQDLARALEKLVRGYISQGDYETPIQYARRWVSLDPLHEPAHQELMRLYAWTGQYAAALRQYQECARILDEELGVEPSQETVDLYEAIKARRLPSPTLSHPPPTSSTEVPEPAKESSLEDKLSRKPLEQQAISHNLPVQSTPFIGRETELSALDDLLGNPNVRLVTILGPGGMGKTRLALAAAERQLARRGGSQTRPYKDGVFFIPLAAVGSLDKIVLALAEQLEIKFHGDTDPADQIIEYLEKQHLLLILDNFEHLITGADFVAAILQRAPNVTVIMTSRERLLIAGEAVYRLGGLAFPNDSDVITFEPEQVIAEYGAVAMFLHHAQLIRPDLLLDLTTLTEAAQICKLVQGMPLAILMAASWVETLSLAELRETIASSVDILASTQRDLPPRQRSIRAVFEASWNRLTPTDQAVFAKLSVFHGGFTRKAAEVVAGANLFTLRTLIEKSLLTPANPDRYELHELLRQLALEKLTEWGEMVKVQEAHSKHYLNALHSLEADIKGQDQANAFAEVDSNLSNIQQAWEWALAQNQFSLIDKALEPLVVFFFYSTRVNEGYRMFQVARGKLKDGADDRLLGRLRARHAWLKSEYGLETTSIEADLDRSWKIAEQKGDQREMAQVLLARGYYLSRIYSDHAAGLRAYERAFQIYQSLNDRFYMTILLTRIGYCQHKDPAKLMDFTRQGLELALETGNRFEAVNAQFNLGAMSFMVGDSILGEQMLHQALELETRKSAKLSYFLSNYLAIAAFLRGDLDHINTHLPPQEHMAIGKVDLITIASTAATMALLSVVHGDLDLAEQLAHRSLSFSSNPDVAFLPYWALAMVHIDRDNLPEARRQLTTAYRVSSITAYPGLMTRSLPVAAVLLAKSDQPKWAAQALSLAMNHPASQVGWLRHWETGAHLRADLEATLGAAAFQAAWEGSKELDLAETILQLAAEFSGEWVVSPPPNNLPPQSTLFIGRETELAALDDLLEDPDVRLMTIVGSGGMGKTRLALAAAERQLNRGGGFQTYPYKDGVYFVPLAPIRSVDSLVPAITGALNLNFSATADPEAQLVNYLQEKQMLLVLDNFEHLLLPPKDETQSGADLVRALLQAAPGVKILVTSRERLHLEQEQLYPIQGLEFPDWETPSDIAEYSAVQLFLQSAKRIQPGFELTPDSLVYLVRICRLAGGMPLGVELAAGWVDTLSLADIAAEIQQSLDFLETDVRDIPERHRSMRAVFDSSWKLMTLQEQDIFSRLSVFRGGFTRQAAQEVAGASLRHLSKLVNKSLLSHNNNRDRYEIHELLRQYAQEKLESNREVLEQIREAHARYFSTFAHQLENDLNGKKQREASDAISADLDNIHLAWAWGVNHTDTVILRECLRGLSWFSQHRGQLMVHHRLFREAFEVFSTNSDERTLPEENQVFLGRLKLHLSWVEHRLFIGDYGAMITSGIEILRRFSAGVEAELAYGLSHLALDRYFKEGSYKNSLKIAQEAMEWATKANDVKEIAYAYNVMGHLAEFQAEYLEAGPFFEKSIYYYDQINENIGRAYAVNNWGRAAYAMGDYDLARRLIEEALNVRQTFDDPIGQAYSLLDLGKLEKMQGNYDKARTHMRTALEISQDVGEIELIGRCHNGLGMVALAEDDNLMAEELHQKSLETFQEIVMIWELPLTYNLLAKVAYNQGNLFQAKERVQQALEANEAIQSRGEQASALRHLGYIALAEGDSSAATSDYRTALEILVETGARPVMLDILVGWAKLLIQKNASEADRLQAVELLSLVAHHPASEHETREQAKALLVEKFADLPAEDLEAAQTRGKELDLEATVLSLIEKGQSIETGPTR